MRHSTRNLQHTVLDGKHKRRSRVRRPAFEGLEERALMSAAHELTVHKRFAIPDKTVNSFLDTPLVSNTYINERIRDPSLVDPWDINFPQLPGIDPPVLVADQGTGVITMYQISMDGSTVTESPFTVTIPTVGSSTPTGPTGVVYDPLNKFSMPGGVAATYIFDTLQGTIEGYNVPKPSNDTSGVVRSPAEILVIPKPDTAEYTGLALGKYKGKYYIYAANDIASPGIDVYNTSFQPANAQLPHKFVDRHLPSGFTPYGVHELDKGTQLIVTYRGPNFVGGAVAEFTNGGKFMRQFGRDTTSSGPLQSPWGAAQFSPLGKGPAPSGFREYSHDLLVGNFSSGLIDAYNFKTGQFDGTLDNEDGAPLAIPGLRTIHFGPGLGTSGQTNVVLLFTADPVDGDNTSIYGEIMPNT